MDPFTQRMLERAEMRSKTLGISSAPKFPLAESNQDDESAFGVSSPSSSSSAIARKHSRASPARKTPSTTPQKTGKRSPRSATKENCDVALEINITAGSHVQVQVEVEERDIDQFGNVLHATRSVREPARRRDVPASVPPSASSSSAELPSDRPAAIRDTSRNRLQRLGALYSDSETISSPIHRNETLLDSHLLAADDQPTGVRSARTGKLAALANSIKTWEDESLPAAEPARRAPSPTAVKRPTTGQSSAGPNRAKSPAPSSAASGSPAKATGGPAKGIIVRQANDGAPERSSPAKQLKWDKNVMDSLEAQGFQRRESNATRIVYDYGAQQDKRTEPESVPVEPKRAEPKRCAPGAEQPPAGEPKSLASVVSKCLVSGRAALFETGSRSGENRAAAKHSHKDPAEMSLKDRMALFEKNKGSALVPKAAFGMSASQRQISAGGEQPSVAAVVQRPVRPPVAVAQQQPIAAADKPSKIDAYNKPVLAESNAAGNCIRNTVAALMNKGATISEAEISSDVRKQRQREMDVLLNRFQRPQNAEPEPEPPSTVTTSSLRSDAQAIPAPPPPPPPPAATQAKRKSAGSSGSERRDQTASPAKADAKRKRMHTTNTAANRLYPVLSDIESTTVTESSDAEDDGTTAVASSDDECAYAAHGYENVDAFARRAYAPEADDSYCMQDDDEDIGDLSLGREIMQAVRRNDQPNVLDTSTTAESDMSSAADVTGDMSDYLDEALAEDDDDETDQLPSTPRKHGSVSSDSFSFARSPAKPPRQPQPNDERPAHKPITSELRVEPSSDNNIVTLTHTVSFYRRQQASVPSTPVRKITRIAEESSPEAPADRHSVVVPEETTDDATIGAPADDGDDGLSEEQRAERVRQQVGEKVRRLLDEIRKQEQVMSQTSQALNLCAATFEFSGSTESVEGERHLLVASHRRQALLQEVQRLRIERCLRDDRVPMDQGRLTVREITVPLTQAYKDKLNSETICGHQLVCLLKYNESVLATKTVPTLPGLLAVKFPDVLQLDGVYADFKITLEIYGMTAQRENVPHELKYHINRKPTKSSKKGADASRLVMPPVQSPGGPGAVRTPALTQYGFVIFSLREIKRTNWTLNQVSPVSPLAGNVYMKANMEIKMHIDMRGFLTMFEDVSGFGAWHRRWCRLHNTQLSYWRYPDDERTKSPIGTIDLKQCWTQKVQAVARDVCARQHTMELEIRRSSEPGDRDSLVLQRKAAGYTVLRHLLSADTKEERVRWSAYFNKALILVRSWGMGSASGTFT